MNMLDNFFLATATDVNRFFRWLKIEKGKRAMLWLAISIAANVALGLWFVVVHHIALGILLSGVVALRGFLLVYRGIGASIELYRAHQGVRLFIMFAPLIFSAVYIVTTLITHEFSPWYLVIMLDPMFMVYVDEAANADLK